MAVLIGVIGDLGSGRCVREQRLGKNTAKDAVQRGDSIRPLSFRNDCKILQDVRFLMRESALVLCLFGGCLAEKKGCLQRLCGDLECKVGWIFSGNGGRRDFVDFRRVFG